MISRRALLASTAALFTSKALGFAAAPAVEAAEPVITVTPGIWDGGFLVPPELQKVIIKWLTEDQTWSIGYYDLTFDMLHGEGSGPPLGLFANDRLTNSRK